MKALIEQVRIFNDVSSITNFEMQKYYQNEAKFNGVYSRDNLPKIKNRAYVINIDEFKSIGTHWIALHLNTNNIIYFDSFGVERIPKGVYNKYLYHTIYKHTIS